MLSLFVFVVEQDVSTKSEEDSCSREQGILQNYTQWL